MTKNVAFLLCLVVLGDPRLSAQVVITTDTLYQQSFDILSGVGPAGRTEQWTDNDQDTLPGWYAYHGRQSTSYTPGPPKFYIIDDGTSTVSGEGLRSYGSLSSGQANSPADRALGELSSTTATIPYSFAVRLLNSSGHPITDYAVSYWGEQWKENTGSNGLVFEYQIGAASITGGTWTPVPALDFAPLKTATARALDGNAPENRARKTGMITDTVAEGGEIWLRWTKMGTSSCGLAVDDLTVTFRPVLEPATEPTFQPTGLSFSQVTISSMVVSFIAAVPPADGYLVVRKQGSASSAIPVDGVAYAAGDSLGDGVIVYSGDETMFQQSGLDHSAEYHFAVFAYNGEGSLTNYLTVDPLVGSQSTRVPLASLESDIVAVNGSEAVNISSLVNDLSPLTPATGVQVWQVQVRDGGAAGDVDAKPTIIRALTLRPASGNTVADWASCVQAMDLFRGSTWLASGSLLAQSVVFAGLSDSVPDDGSLTLTFRISLKSSGIVDGAFLQFSLSSSDVVLESDSTSSQLKSMVPISSGASTNIIEVVATGLTFVRQPVTSLIGMPIAPSVIVAAADANGNPDCDYTAAISMTATGAVLDGAPVAVLPQEGVAEFPSLRLLTGGTNVVLTAASGSFSTPSAAFQVLTHRSFHVDADLGNDSADGLTPTSAWKTLSKVNLTIFQPGDSLLFKSGSAWTGMLNPKGSGDSNAPIVIGKYGGTIKPIINGNGIIGFGTVYLFNQQYWEVNDLEITNDAATGADRRGVYVVFNNIGLARHIHLKGLDIHNVKGLIGHELYHKKTASIGIETNDNGTAPTRLDDLLIEGCTIANIENTGLYTANLATSAYPLTADWMTRRFTNVRVRNNTIHHISKNAMILRFLDGGLVEYNVCYETATGVTGNTMFTSGCNGTVFQFNEGYLNRASLHGTNDGSMYDPDLRSMNIVFQYSYSHDNSQGLLWTCTEQPDTGIICRYNVSRNDQGAIFCISYPVTSAYIYNNTVYIGSSVSPTIISERNVGTGTRTYHFYNNIIYNLSPGATYDMTSSYTRIVNSNLFYGFHPTGEPADPNKQTSDPLFVNPDSGGIGLGAVVGLRLRSNSPCIDNALPIPNSGGFDYWSNSVPTGAAADRGAFEYVPPVSVTPLNGATPQRFAVKQNYPNPFNPSTHILFDLPASGRVSVAVYNILGAEVRSLVDADLSAGSHQIAWDGRSSDGRRLSSGVYYGVVRSREASRTIKMLLMQ